MSESNCCNGDKPAPDYFATAAQTFFTLYILRLCIILILNKLTNLDSTKFKFKGSTLEWYGHYALFVLLVYLIFAIVGSYSLPAGYLVCALFGSQLQGYYGCKHQEYIARHYLLTSYLAGALNAVVCCIIQNQLHQLSFAISDGMILAGSTIFLLFTVVNIYACKKYMCRIEAAFIALRQREFTQVLAGHYTNKF